MSIFTEVCICAALLAHAFKCMTDGYMALHRHREDQKIEERYERMNRNSEWDMGLDSRSDQEDL